MVTCSKCRGRGTVECPICNGIGRINHFKSFGVVTVNCSCCDGHRDINCPQCDGLGGIPSFTPTPPDLVVKSESAR